MALMMRSTVAEKLLNISKMSAQVVTTKCRISPAPAVSTRVSEAVAKAIEPDPGDKRNRLSRRFIHQQPEMRNVPAGNRGALIEKLWELNTVKDRIRLDGFRPPSSVEITAEQTRKLIKAAQLEMVKSRLRETAGTAAWISHSDFVRICGEGCSYPSQGPDIAKSLDESGQVIVIGNTVLLRPDQVAKTLGQLLPQCDTASPADDCKRRELEELEQQKAEIDVEANAAARRELWAGLGFLVVQTAAFMRLTFWELSWDVMEPICFYVTSFYFMGCYAFFLRTSKEPSFEGFYETRFGVKQRQVMRSRGFDAGRYLELRRVLYPPCSPEDFLMPPFDQTKKMHIGFQDHKKKCDTF